jgi:hypothetical protein
MAIHKKLALIFILAALSSCNGGKVLDIKSPCVSNNDGPCGPRKSVNDWWIKNNNKNS